MGIETKRFTNLVETSIGLEISSDIFREGIRLGACTKAKSTLVFS